MRATRIPNTVQRWYALAIPVGIVIGGTIGLWCIVKSIKEWRASK